VSFFSFVFLYTLLQINLQAYTIRPAEAFRTESNRNHQNEFQIFIPSHPPVISPIRVPVPELHHVHSNYHGTPSGTCVTGLCVETPCYLHTATCKRRLKSRFVNLCFSSRGSNSCSCCSTNSSTSC